MPNKLTPEYRRAYRARCIAEGRCANCGAQREPEDAADSRNLCCRACRKTKNKGSQRRYSARRKTQPPGLAFLLADPDQPFRYGKTRLKNPRRVTVKLDWDTLEMFDRLRKNWIPTPDYQPYQVSEFIRRALSVLQNHDGPIHCNGRLRRRDSSGLSVCFMCDEDNYALLQRQRDETGCTLPAALRDCLRHAARILAFHTPNEEAKRLLWPGYRR